MDGFEKKLGVFIEEEGVVALFRFVHIVDTIGAKRTDRQGPQVAPGTFHTKKLKYSLMMSQACRGLGWAARFCRRSIRKAGSAPKYYIILKTYYIILYKVKDYYIILSYSHLHEQVAYFYLSRKK